MLEESDEQPNGHANGGNAPVDKINLFPVSASIWMRYSAEGKPFYSVSFQRAYKDAQGQWQYTQSFGSSDLLVLAEAARQAYMAVEQMRQKDRNDG